MKPIKRKPFSKRLGSALVMTLVIIVLITVVTVGYLASVMLETKTAGSALDQERAYGVAMIGVHEAMSRVRDALGPWDDPYKNFAANAPPFYWSVSPGRLTRWAYADIAVLKHTLFSRSARLHGSRQPQPAAERWILPDHQRDKCRRDKASGHLSKVGELATRSLPNR